MADGFVLKLNIPTKLQKSLKDSTSILHKTLSAGIEKSLIIMQGEVKKNIVPGWNAGFKRGIFIGKLNAAVVYKMEKLKGVLGVKKIYAAIQEFGGTITPKTAKALFVPLTRKARKGRGKLQFGIDFILTQKVTIKPKKYFERGVEKGFKEATRKLNELIAQMVKRMGFDK